MENFAEADTKSKISGAGDLSNEAVCSMADDTYKPTDLSKPLLPQMELIDGASEGAAKAGNTDEKSASKGAVEGAKAKLSTKNSEGAGKK